MRCPLFDAIALVTLHIPLIAATAPAAAGESGALGRHIDAFSARDFRGKETSLADFADSRAVVVVFLGTECPLAKLYAPRLAELAAEYRDRGVAFVGVDANRHDSISEMANYARVHGVAFPLLKDVGNAIADQFGAQRTPEAFLLDRDRRIRYHGRIDDQYGLGSSSGYAQAKVRRRYLADAIDDVLAARDVATPHTDAPGCLIGRVREVKPDSPITYSNQVARILQRNCVECHRSGQIAPFALTNYDEVSGWADMIDEVVRQQRMPPWHADPQFGHFSNDRSMSEADKQTLYAWVANGAPEGDPADLPEAVEFPETWQIPGPDQVVYMDDEPYDVPAEGTVEYQYFMVDPGWTEDRWIKSTECRIGNRAVVHHIFVFAISPENALAKLDGRLGEGIQPGLGDNSIRLIAGAAPGTPPATGPKGAATLVKAGTKLLFQMHYTPNGSPQQDRSCVGFEFCPAEQVTHNVEVHMAINPSFTIPAGADNFPVTSAHKFPKDSLLLNFSPHMHLRGKSFRYDLKYPDGTTETILNVPRYDFNWQVTYMLAKPKFVPAGTEMRCLAHFDNSAENLANPDPTADVSWGDQTWQEMMIGWFNETTDVYPEDVDPAQTRTARFLADSERNPPKLGKILSRAAQAAAKSPAAMEKFLERLQREIPQVDRVCIATVDEGQLRFVQVAQPSVLDYPLGGVDRRYPAAQSALARYTSAAQPVAHPDLTEAEGTDVAAMRRVLGSSLHVPILVDGKPAVVSFWSKEKNAFPPAAAAFLQPLAKLVGGGD